MPKLTIKAATFWLSEHWGIEIETRDVKLRGEWLFWRDREYGDVECIYNPKNDGLWGETWAGITLEESPWKGTPEVVAQTVAKLDKDITAYIAEYH
jgi:hypothetical protein